jgi:hypothetical protein
MSIKTLCARWQKLLRLQDWDIVFKVLDDKDYETREIGSGFKVGETGAVNAIDAFRKHSTIYLKKSNPEPELYLLHELCHILLAPLDDLGIPVLAYIPSLDTRQHMTLAWTDALEESVWNMARALYSIHKAQK